MSAEDELKKLQKEVKDKEDKEKEEAKKKRLEEGDDDEDEPSDTYAPQASFQFLSAVQIFVCLFGAAMEVTRFVYDAQGLVARADAAMRHDLANVDAENASCLLYVLTGTAISPQPGAYIAGVLWRVSNLVAFIFVAISAIPARWPVSGLWSEWNRVFGVESSSWYEGWILALIGSGFIGNPTWITGTELSSTIRYVAGWALIGFGGFLIFLGMYFGRSIRWRRGQKDKPANRGSILDRVKAERARFSKAFNSVYAIRVQMGMVEGYLDDFDDALGRC